MKHVHWNKLPNLVKIRDIFEGWYDFNQNVLTLQLKSSVLSKNLKKIAEHGS